MHTSEIVFIHNNLLHVLAAHAAILRETIKRIKIKDNTIIEVPEPMQDIKRK
jgi:hypothetical protein